VVFLQRLIYKGAEAEVFETDFQGKKAIEKRRILKGYRCRELDSEIRGKRTRLEASLLSAARKAGVRTPAVLKVDGREKTIFMEFIEGKKARDLEGTKREWAAIGKKIGSLHSAGIIHGDLTTRNIIAAGNGNIAFVDFGLGFYSKKSEDRAFDLLNLKKILLAEDEAGEKRWEKIIAGYREAFPGAKEVISRLEEAEGRGRYT